MNVVRDMLHELVCKIEGHSLQKIIGFCIDSNCKENNKLVCLECIFSVHSQHKLIKINELENQINQLKEDYDNNKVDKEISYIVDKTTISIDDNLKKLESIFIENLTTKMKDYAFSLKNHLKSLSENNRDQYIEELIHNNNYYYNSNEELSKYLLKIYNYISVKKNNNQKNDQKDHKTEIIESLSQFESHFSEYMKTQTELVSDFINKQFLTISKKSLFDLNVNFEWSNKTYGTYGFFYNLSEDKLTATKKNPDGTITILRAKDPLALGKNYRIEYLVQSEKCGDFDIGFGKDTIGNTCWLRTGGSYALTNMGVYIEGKVANKARINDKDKVAMEIKLAKAPYEGTFYINGKKIIDFNITIDEIYPMCAIRKTNNSITMTKCITI